MSWWPKRRRDLGDPFDLLEDGFLGRGFFRPSEYLRDFDQSFRQMREEMNSIIEKARRGELESPKEGGPYVYGWSMRVGPDGIPHVEEFGNTKGIASGSMEGLPAGREPLVDVLETEDQVKVTAELPGVEKKDVNLETTEHNLTITVSTEKRNYYKNVDLPVSVKADSAKATYNNGVLEVCLDKQAPEKKGKKIQIG